MARVSYSLANQHFWEGGAVKPKMVYWRLAGGPCLWNVVRGEMERTSATGGTFALA